MELIKTSPIYHTSIEQKSRAKNAAHQRFKYGSPTLINMMREKCRLRIKEARSSHLLLKRNIVQEEKELLASIVRQELSELEKDIELQELIFQELIAETDEWLFEEYERSGCYMIDEYGEEIVFCPICQKDKLTIVEQGDFIVCSCGVRFKHADGIDRFGKIIQAAVENHGITCSDEVHFFVEPGASDCSPGRLNVFCSNCDFCQNLTK